MQMTQVNKSKKYYENDFTIIRDPLETLMKLLLHCDEELYKQTRKKWGICECHSCEI